MMNHLVIHYLEVFLCSSTPSKHEGKYDLPEGYQERVSEVRTPGSISRSEELPLSLLFFPFPRNVNYPVGLQLNALWLGSCCRSNRNSLDEDFSPFELSEHFLGSLRVQLLHYLLTLCITGDLLA